MLQNKAPVPFKPVLQDPFWGPCSYSRLGLEIHPWIQWHNICWIGRVSPDQLTVHWTTRTI